MDKGEATGAGHSKKMGKTIPLKTIKLRRL
jgi:hypothetical protein